MSRCFELADVGLALGGVGADRSDCLEVAGIHRSRKYRPLPLAQQLLAALLNLESQDPDICPMCGKLAV